MRTFFTSPVKGTGLKGVELVRRHFCVRLQGPPLCGLYMQSYMHTVIYLSCMQDQCYQGGFDEEGRRHVSPDLKGNCDPRSFSFTCLSLSTSPPKGYGTYSYPNHIIFDGLFHHGSKHGEGKLSFPDGGYYQGQFHENEIHGHGMRKFASGHTYTGQFSCVICLLLPYMSLLPCIRSSLLHS